MLVFATLRKDFDPVQDERISSYGILWDHSSERSLQSLMTHVVVNPLNAAPSTLLDPLTHRALEGGTCLTFLLFRGDVCDLCVGVAATLLLVTELLTHHYIALSLRPDSRRSFSFAIRKGKNGALLILFFWMRVFGEGRCRPIILLFRVSHM